ncbi:MAG: toll/interleukin-1 receptor domain-containing protein [Anaerolineae bacterium]|nr:toll/interleukin-1 receptor domain-containing protein [Anaerolineae bacterium]
MADLFISYSRRDEPFVRRLHDALAARQKDVWVDLEDIPSSSDWWDEIQAGIEASDAFIFVISPDSAQSEVCLREIRHAESRNKRFIPVVWRKISDAVLEKNLPPVIKKTNWIFFGEAEEEFDHALATLLVALATDLSYVHEHTRLWLRAISWQTAHHDSSQLLRGNELKAAEEWLAAGLAGDHALERNQPTRLHIEFIQSSHRARNYRCFRMVVLAIAIIAIGVFLITRIFAVGERGQQEVLTESALRSYDLGHDRMEAGDYASAVRYFCEARRPEGLSDDRDVNTLGLNDCQTGEDLQLSHDTWNNFTFHLGKACLFRGNFQCATESMTYVIEHNPADLSAYNLLAMIWRENGDDAKAAQVLNDAEVYHAAHPEVSINEAWISVIRASLAFEQQDWAGTKDQLTALVEKTPLLRSPTMRDQHPNVEEVYFYLAVSYQKLGETTLACENWAIYQALPRLNNAPVMNITYQANERKDQAADYQQTLDCSTLN